MADEIWYMTGQSLLAGYKLIDDSTATSSDLIGPLRQINIFVGPNNSGKSRLMRQIIRIGAKKWNVPTEDFRNALQSLQKVANSWPILGNIPIEVESEDLAIEGFPKLAELMRIRPNSGKITISMLRLLEEVKQARESLEAMDHPAKRQSGKGSAAKLDELIKDIEFVILVQDPEHAKFRKLAGSLPGVPDPTPYQPKFLSESQDLQWLKEVHKNLEICREFIEMGYVVHSKTYIPVLRSTFRLGTPLSPNPQTSVNDKKTANKSNPALNIFQETIRHLYKANLRPVVEIFTGQELYQEIVVARNGDKDERKRFQDFEQWLRDQFFAGKDIEIVAKVEKWNNPEDAISAFQQQSIRIHIAGEAERVIHDLGDGIQALIMLTFPIFMAKPNSFIFIEEPELNLHPGMQRIFLEVISMNPTIKQKNLKFFLTTHSNHFLDLTITEDAPVSIFTLRKASQLKGEEQFEIRNVHSGNKGILEQLGVQNSSVYIANCSIWVEGHTDRKYIRKYLQELMRQKKEWTAVKEDLNYAFFEYSGANLAHYRFGHADNESEAHSTIDGLRLNSAVYVIGDGDQKDKRFLERFQKIKSEGFEYFPLENSKEIENLLTPSILSKVLPRITSLKNLLKGKEVEIAALKHEDYASTSLLEFIYRKFGPNDVEKPPKSFSSAQKREICDLAIPLLSWEEMSDEAKRLAEDVYNFIAKANGSQKRSLEDSDLQNEVEELEENDIMGGI